MTMIFNPMHNPSIGAETDRDYGYLHHGHGTNGPYRTERVEVKNLYGSEWRAWFEGRWRKVHIQVNRTFIIYRGERITIQIDGV